MTNTNRSKRRQGLVLLVANGVNLDLLGRREPEVYGHATLLDLERTLTDHAPGLAREFGLPTVKLHFFQSNDEASFLTKLSEQAWDGVLLNPGAWTHTSLALGDRLAALQLPFVEVHLSQLKKREAFRQHSYAAPHALGVVEGFGLASYLAGLTGLLAKIARYP